jgi:HCOMODA/2-hydroxy-3-carboxy-muconic semialdehyde decarboxylase
MHYVSRRDLLMPAAILTLSVVAGSLSALAQDTVAPASIAADLSPDLVDDLVAANRILAHYGMFDAYGHISVRSRSNPNRYLMARYLPPASATPADITVYDLDSKALDPAVKRSFSERFIHGEIYRARPDVMSVVHNHAPSLIPFSLSDKPLLPVMHTGAFLGGGVPVFDAAKFIPDTNMMIQSPAAARALANTLGQRPVALIRGHGAVVVGDSIRQATFRSYYAEMNGRVLAGAMALGGRVHALNDQEARRAEASAVAPVPVDRAWIHWRKEVLGK